MVNNLDFFFGHVFFGVALYNTEFIGLAYQGKDILFRFIIEYSSLRNFGS
jgi:hypothetical protein